jgi:predicted TIM-barrel fold metal-dependent hydrolase
VKLSQLNRREFLGVAAALPLAAESLVSAQRAPIPIIDTHIHLFDKSRPEGSPYPGETSLLGKNYQHALPADYREVSKAYGVVGAIVIEAQIGMPRIEDNQWVLDVANKDPFIVGTQGRLDPASAEFPKLIDRFKKDKLFLGIRQSQLAPALDNPGFLQNLRLMAQAGLCVDAIPANNRPDAAAILLKVTDLVPDLRLIVDHYPNARLPEDATARAAYMTSLKELGKRPHVWIKLSEVVKKFDDVVSADVSKYKDWLDQLWDIFGEDKIMFGSDWPQSETLELNSYPHVMTVARTYVMSKGPAAMEKVFWKNSIPAYKWIRRDSSQPQA